MVFDQRDSFLGDEPTTLLGGLKGKINCGAPGLTFGTSGGST